MHLFTNKGKPFQYFCSYAVKEKLKWRSRLYLDRICEMSLKLDILSRGYLL